MPAPTKGLMLLIGKSKSKPEAESEAEEPSESSSDMMAAGKAVMRALDAKDPKALARAIASCGRMAGDE